MAISYEKIAESFTRLRSFFLHDLDLIVSQEVGGNYAAILLVMAACETLGRIRYGTESGGARFFSDYLLPTRWQKIACHLYDALRNGLSHSYDTKTIVQVGEQPIVISISWRKKPHLFFDNTISTLYINVPELTKALHLGFCRYEKELLSDPSLRELFRKWIVRKTEIHVRRKEDRETWQALLQEANVE